jgi:hypothetical protein
MRRHATAYDTVPRAQLWEKLHAAGLGGEWLRAVQALYADVPMAVRTADGVSAPFQARIGLKQGCPAKEVLAPARAASFPLSTTAIPRNQRLDAAAHHTRCSTFIETQLTAYQVRFRTFAASRAAQTSPRQTRTPATPKHRAYKSAGTRADIGECDGRGRLAEEGRRAAICHVMQEGCSCPLRSAGRYRPAASVTDAT